MAIARLRLKRDLWRNVDAKVANRQRDVTLARVKNKKKKEKEKKTPAFIRKERIEFSL